VVLSIKKQAPGGFSQEARECVSDTRVFGASVLLAERGKPEAVGRAQNTRLAKTR